MNTLEETASLCALNRIFGFEPKIGTALLEHFGSAGEVMRLSRKDQELLLGPHSKHAGQICMRAIDDAARELNDLQHRNIFFIGQTQRHYPALLRDCPDAPIGLYVRSTTPAEELFRPHPNIAVIGTRNLSLYGEEWCRQTVASLSATPEKPRIISGLALGTDICAHKSAIEHGLPTIAVMATGPETVYPWRHTGFAEKMVCTPGCALITDYPPGTAPLAIHFLRRNRIIAGLSDATVVIESKIKGGAMTTARLAFSYDRDVYALPGRVDDIRSQGCNMLIRSKIAEPLTSIPEFLDTLGIERFGTKDAISEIEVLTTTYRQKASSDNITQMANLLRIIRRKRGITIEELSDYSGLGYARTVELASILETDGFIMTDLLQRCCIAHNKR